MRIDAVIFTVLRYALEKRYGDAQGLKTHRTTLLVRIDTDAGVVGWGDIANARNDANGRGSKPGYTWSRVGVSRTDHGTLTFSGAVRDGSMWWRSGETARG